MKEPGFNQASTRPRNAGLLALRGAGRSLKNQALEHALEKPSTKAGDYGYANSESLLPIICFLASMVGIMIYRHRNLDILFYWGY